MGTYRIFLFSQSGAGKVTRQSKICQNKSYATLCETHGNMCPPAHKQLLTEIQPLLECISRASICDGCWHAVKSMLTLYLATFVRSTRWYQIHLDPTIFDRAVASLSLNSQILALKSRITQPQRSYTVRDHSAGQSFSPIYFLAAKNPIYLAHCSNEQPKVVSAQDKHF